MSGPAERGALVHRSLAEISFAVVDLETTGLYPDQGDRICEVAIVHVDRGAVTSEWSSLVNPLRAISPGASRVSGITDDEVKSAKPMSELADIVFGRLEKRVVVAHNAKFDLGFLQNELEPLGYRLSDQLAVDTLFLSRHHFRSGKHNLDAVAKRLGVPSEMRHRALGDARMTAAVLLRFIEMARGEILSALFPRPCTFRLESPDPFGPTLLVIEEAIKNGADLAITYCSPFRGATTVRRIRPIERVGDFYLDAFCYMRQARRRFRIDRISDVAHPVGPNAIMVGAGECREREEASLKPMA